MFALVDTKNTPTKLIKYNNKFTRVPIENGWSIIYVGEEKIDPKELTENTDGLIWFECSSNVKLGQFYFDKNLNEIVETPNAEPTEEMLKRHKESLESVKKIIASQSNV